MDSTAWWVQVFGMPRCVAGSLFYNVSKKFSAFILRVEESKKTAFSA